ncbi:MAG TPA: esterase-like activity of phytase family protein [Armatimonadota bacterium]|nr:esterase-like activity of phytase family protein [Armatimonadota bacterium]
MPGLRIIVCIISITLLLCQISAFGAEIKGIGSVQISGSEQVIGLSGLTYAGPVTGERDTFLYYAVSDRSRTLYGIHVELNMSTGAILSAKIASKQQLAEGGDLEGIAYDAVEGAIYTSDESGTVIRKYRLKTKSSEPLNSIRTLSISNPLPAVLKNVRDNLSLESLALETKQWALWTANEEALEGDGEPSTTKQGTVVRLIKLNKNLEPVGQWAYITDPIRSTSPIDNRERSGVSDLAVLPDGTIIVLEREADIREFASLSIPDFRIRLYEVVFDNAADVSKLNNGLSGNDYTPVGKRLLWERRFPLDNYEGLALGPHLGGNTWSLIMISDDQGGLLQQNLYSLVVKTGP